MHLYFFPSRILNVQAYVVTTYNSVGIRLLAAQYAPDLHVDFVSSCLEDMLRPYLGM
jgi:hypothetical protein